MRSTVSMAKGSPPASATVKGTNGWRRRNWLSCSRISGGLLEFSRILHRFQGGHNQGKAGHDVSKGQRPIGRDVLLVEEARRLDPAVTLIRRSLDPNLLRTVHSCP